MSSIRVAVKPRATNSSSAASMMAPRRSAARSARLEASALGDAGLGGLAGAPFSPRRPAAGFAPPRPLADFDPGPGPVFDMRQYVTDWSVIVNWTEGNDCHVAVTRRSAGMECQSFLREANGSRECAR